MKGDVQYGCNVSESPNGRKEFTPTIRISQGGKSIEFIADSFCKTEQDAIKLVKIVYSILSGAQLDVEVSNNEFLDAIPNPKNTTIN